MDLSESGIIEFFDGTYIDLSRILEVSSIRLPEDLDRAPFGWAGFSIRYMFQSEERRFGYSSQDLLSMEEIRAINQKHYDAAQAYGGSKSYAMSRAELQRLTEEAVRKHHLALIEAWAVFKTRNPSTVVPKVSA